MRDFAHLDFGLAYAHRLDHDRVVAGCVADIGGAGRGERKPARFSSRSQRANGGAGRADVLFHSQPGAEDGLPVDHFHYFLLGRSRRALVDWLTAANPADLTRFERLSRDITPVLPRSALASPVARGGQAKPVEVNTQYSFRKQDCLYDENIPREDLNPKVYAENRYWNNNLSILICPSQKFSSYPYVKVRDVSNWPNITFDYESGISLSNNATTFNKIKLKLKDSYVNMRLLGYFSYNIEANTFVGNTPSFFGDFLHPTGNQLQSPIGIDFSSFNLLPYYEFSTDKYYVQFNFRHHFNGFIFDKIPLLNKTSLKMVTGCSALYEHYKGHYIEPFVGIENFRIGPIQLFDIDYTWSFDINGYRNQGITFRLAQLLNN